MNAIVRFMAVTFMVMAFSVVNVVFAAGSDTTLPNIEYSLENPAGQGPSTGMRYVAVPEGWVVPSDFFNGLPDDIKAAVPSGRGDLILDYIALRRDPIGIEWRRTGVTFRAFIDGTPGTTKMRKTMFYPEGYGVSVNGDVIISHAYFADGECHPRTASADKCLDLYPWIKANAPQFVDEGFGGWSVILPTVNQSTGQLSCPSGTNFLFKVYNAGYSKINRGLRNDSNHRFVSNLDLLAKQKTVPGWEQSYVDGVYCVPEQVNELRVSNPGASIVLDPGETGLSWANYHTVFNLNAVDGGPMNVLLDNLTFGRIDYDASRSFAIQGGAFRRQRIASAVEEFYRPGVIQSSQTDEMTGYTYHLNQSLGGSTSAELWRDNANSEPTYKIQLSQLVTRTDGNRYETATDMLLYTQVFQDSVSGIVTSKSKAVAAFLNGVYNSGKTTDIRGKLVFIDLNDQTPVVTGELALDFAPQQIAIDKIANKLYLVRYAERPFEQVSGIATIDLATQSLQSFEAWPFEGSPLSVQVDSRTKRLYVGSQNFPWVQTSGGWAISLPRTTYDNVYVKDLATNQWLRDQNGQTIKIQVGFEPISIQIGAHNGTNYVYALNSGTHGTGNSMGNGHYEEDDFGLNEIDPDLLRSVRRFKTEQQPYSMVSAPRH